MTWLADRQAQVVAAIGATLNALVLIDLVQLSGEQVAGLNSMFVAWLGVLVVPKAKAAKDVEIAHSGGYSLGMAETVNKLHELAPTAAKRPTKRAVRD